MGNPPLVMRVQDAVRGVGRVLFRRAPLRPRGGLPGGDPFFVIGSGRSGNTLLRAMLVAHPALSVPPESYVLPDVVRKFCRFRYLPWRELSRLLISEFERYPDFYTWEIDLGPFYARAAELPEAQRNLAALLDAFYRYYAERKHPGATRWGDKTPLNTLHLDRLHWVFPQARYVHILRDGRDVVASYLESGIYRELEAAADRWRRSVSLARRFGAEVAGARYMELRYEGLVADPAGTLGQVCAFLGVTYEPAMLDFWKASDRLGDTVLPHHANVANPVNTASIGKWRDKLDAGQRRVLARSIGSMLQTLGYGPADDGGEVA